MSVNDANDANEHRPVEAPLNKWISVDERLPDYDTPIIVLTDRSEVFPATLSANEWFYQMKRAAYTNDGAMARGPKTTDRGMIFGPHWKSYPAVTHWQSLPAPPGAQPLPAPTNPDFPAILERERTLVAEGVTNIKKAIHEREWLTEGRGSYEWNDDRWHGEFAAAIKEILEAVKPLERIACDWTNCPQTWEGAQKARADLIGKPWNAGAEPLPAVSPTPPTEGWELFWRTPTGLLYKYIPGETYLSAEFDNRNNSSAAVSPEPGVAKGEKVNIVEQNGGLRNTVAMEMYDKGYSALTPDQKKFIEERVTQLGACPQCGEQPTYVNRGEFWDANAHHWRGPVSQPAPDEAK